LFVYDETHIIGGAGVRPDVEKTEMGAQEMPAFPYIFMNFLLTPKFM